jgi:ABC-type bacteriocin/lantibiotic exporter with double-glycine peptidase domain
MNYFIIGPSGSGKSTFIDILSCIIQPENINYKINSKNYTNKHLKNLNNYVSYVPQQINFFNRTLLENITLNFNNNSKNDIVLVNDLIELLELKDFLSNLPNGLNSYLGEQIQNMSGGQRQRLSIARALFRKKPILILDEATSSIDFETEKKIFDRLKKLSFLKSFIAITHRYSFINEEDQCISMNQGRITFQGKYKIYKNIKENK